MVANQVNAQLGPVYRYPCVDLLQENMALIRFDNPPGRAKLRGRVCQPVKIFVGGQIGPCLRKQISGESAGGYIGVYIGGDAVAETSSQRSGRIGFEPE